MTGAQDAVEILQGVVSRYASLHSYCDRGSVAHRRSNSISACRIPFSTYFLQPIYRFQFGLGCPTLEGSTHHAVGYDGRSVYRTTRHANGSIETYTVQSLETAVAGVTGISHGSAHTIARLLLPQIGGISYRDLREVRLHAVRELDGTECFVLYAEHPQRAAHYELWVERRRLLLRRQIAQHASLVSEESRHDIRIDEPIDGERFLGLPTTHALAPKVGRESALIGVNAL